MQLGCLWGDKANLSELMSRIAQGKIKLEAIDAICCPRCDAKAYKNGRRGKVQAYYCPRCDRGFQLEQGDSPQDRRRKRKISAKEMKELRAAGKTLEEIRVLAGISREGVRQAIEALD